MNTMEKIITNDIMNHISHYFHEIYTKKSDLYIDGVKAFNEKSKFVEGKVVNACSYLVEKLIEKGGNKTELTTKLMEIIDFVSKGKFETWGMLNCIIGLYRLKEKNLLKSTISEKAMKRLKSKLDWRDFVNTENLALINKPTNYYGVAYGVARYRELLEWEEEGWSEKLLNKLMEHVKKFSGQFSFMDETIGDGRFDRYSTLIPAEICSLLLDTRCNIPDKLLKMLRKSSKIYLNLANNHGHGFSYGRSIGAYGDTATLEILSIASRLNILTNEEKEFAYNYNVRTIQKFIEFWIDKDMKSINMWEKARATDSYRNKNRILGENLSLCMQLINSYEYWKEINFQEKDSSLDYEEKLMCLPKFSLYKFADNKYTRAMCIIRDRKHVMTLPLVNGHRPYYGQTPYIPIPNENGVLESMAESYHPNLITKIGLESGKEVMPIVFIKNINHTKINKDSDNYCNKLIYDIDSLCSIEEKEPKRYEKLKAICTYSFRKGSIEKETKFYSTELQSNIQYITMEFATFSQMPKIKGNTVIFGEGDICEIEATGFDFCTVDDISDNQLYRTSHGSLKHLVKWTKRFDNRNKVHNSIDFITGWQIKYK